MYRWWCCDIGNREGTFVRRDEGKHIHVAAVDLRCTYIRRPFGRLTLDFPAIGLHHIHHREQGYQRCPHSPHSWHLLAEYGRLRRDGGAEPPPWSRFFSLFFLLSLFFSFWTLLDPADAGEQHEKNAGGGNGLVRFSALSLKITHYRSLHAALSFVRRNCTSHTT